MSVVSRETMAHVETVAKFFGIDLEWNRHIFRAASEGDTSAFATVMRAMAGACECDARRGVTDRIKAKTAQSKGRAR